MTDSTALWLIYFTAVIGVLTSLITLFIISKLGHGKIRGMALQLLGVMLIFSIGGVFAALRDVHGWTTLGGLPIAYVEYAFLFAVFVVAYLQLSRVQSNYCFES